MTGAVHSYILVLNFWEGRGGREAPHWARTWAMGICVHYRYMHVCYRVFVPHIHGSMLV